MGSLRLWAGLLSTAHGKKAASEVTPFGALIQPFDLPLADGVHTVVAQHPLAMLHVVARDCEPFRNTLEQALRRKPPSAEAPWGLVMYCDEIGHNLVGRDERKIDLFTGASWS